VDNAGLRQWIVLQILSKALPIERDFLASPIEPLENQPFGHCVIALYHPAVSTDAIVLVMASQLGLEYRPPILNLCSTPYLPEPGAQFFAGSTKSLVARLATQSTVTSASLTPVVGKAQKLKRMGLRSTSVKFVSFISAEVDNTGNKISALRSLKEHPDTVKALNDLIVVYDAWGKPEKADEL